MGIDIPMRDRTVMIRSWIVLCFVDARIPAGMPTYTAKKSAVRLRSSVVGTLSNIRDITFCL